MTSTSASFITPLTTYSIVRVSGVDAETFLQGQLSCDLKEVSQEKSCLGAANTQKGRAYAVFRITKLGNDYLIRLPSELAPDFIARLSKYIVFSKAKIALEEQWCILGAVGTNIISTKPLPTEVDGVTDTNNNIIISVPSSTTPRYEIWCDQSFAQSLLDEQKELSRTEINYSQIDWDWLDVNEGITDVFTQTQESFVPQMLNLQHLNAISFKKGCYTGQEIIARMKYLGKLKKATFLLSVSPAIDSLPGASVFEKGSEKKQGTIVRSVNSPSHDTTLALAVLDIESVKSGLEFSLTGNNDNPAKLISLPYEE